MNQVRHGGLRCKQIRRLIIEGIDSPLIRDFFAATQALRVLDFTDVSQQMQGLRWKPPHLDDLEHRCSCSILAPDITKTSTDFGDFGRAENNVRNADLLSSEGLWHQSRIIVSPYA